MSHKFCKVWTVIQSYLTIVSFMSIHGAWFFSNQSSVKFHIFIPAIFAIRVYALHNGRLWICRLLWVSTVLYLMSSTIIITVAQVPIICT